MTSSVPADTSERPSLTVVIPAYNEETGLERITREALEALQTAVPGSEIVIVDDGSSDATGSVADRLAGEFPEVKAVHHQTNQGSGMAIRSGIANATCDLVMYVPADDQFDLTEIGAYAQAAGEADIVVGVRDSRSDYSWFRLLSSWAFLKLTNTLFGFHYRDVNWVHLWRRRIFDEVELRSRGVPLMVEILVRATREGYTSVEIDSVYRPRASGKAKGSSIRSIALAIYEIFRLWFEVRVRRNA